MRKAVDDQAGDEVESHVDGAVSNEEVQETIHQIQVAEEQRVHDNGVETRTTKQDGEEDSFESTEVSAWKATESRNEVQKVSEG